MAYSEKLKRNIENLERAFKKLNESQFFEYDHEINVELVTKRFEYAFELLWKTLKIYLFDEKGLETYSPVDCFKSAFQTGLIPQDLEQNILSMVRKRNEIVHIYDEIAAEKIYEDIISKFIKSIEIIIDKINKSETVE
jgi:nucleotidyltransferase substrate binding protein (TIGR01987 family)